VPFSFLCPGCQNEIKVSRKLQGTIGKCPSCEKHVKIPHIHRDAPDEVSDDDGPDEAADDIAKRLATKGIELGVFTPERLATAATRAARESIPLTRALLAEAGTFGAPSILALLRFLHSGIENETPDAFERHVEGLIAASAIRADSLSEKDLEKGRRKRGDGRLGSALVDLGVLEEEAARSIEKKWRKARAVCPSCFAETGAAETPCPVCGREITRDREKERWLDAPAEEHSDVAARPEKQPSDAPAEKHSDAAEKDTEAAAKAEKHPDVAPKRDGAARAEEHAAPADPTPPAGLTETKRAASRSRVPRAPEPRAPEPPPVAPAQARLQARRNALLSLGLVGVALVVVVISVVTASHGAARTAERWERFRGQAAAAASEKGRVGSVAVVASSYQVALETAEGLEATEPADQDLLARTREEAASSRRLAQALGDETALADAIRKTNDPAILACVAAALGPETRPTIATAALGELVKKDQATALRALDRAIQIGGAVAASTIRTATEVPDEIVAREAARKSAARAGDTGASSGRRIFRDTESVPELMEEARDELAAVSDPAVMKLCTLAPPEAAGEIALGLDGPTDLKKGALAALKKIGDAGIPALAKAFRGGQASAAVGLSAIGSPGAIRAIFDAFPPLDWKTRLAALDTITREEKPGPALAAAVEALLAEARSAIHRGTADLDQLRTLVIIARACGIREAADGLEYELALVAMEKNKKSVKILDDLVRVDDRTDLGEDGRIEVENGFKFGFLCWIVGPRCARIALPATAVSGINLAPGKYRIAIGLDPSLWGLLASFEVVAGKAQHVFLGKVQGKDEAPPPPQVAEDPKASERAKHEVARVFRGEQLLDEGRAAIEASAQKSPFKGGVSIETAHYAVTSDAPRAQAQKAADAAEAAYAEYAKFIPAGADHFKLRFFSTKADFDAWRLSTSLNAYVASRLVKERNLVARARRQVERAAKAGLERGTFLSEVADMLETPAGLDRVGLDDLVPFEDSLERLENGSDTALDKGIAEALRSIEYLSLITFKNGSTIVGYHNRDTKELCLFQAEGWEATLRHEAFHQFLVKRAPKAPPWLHEGLATYFEAYPDGGRNASRIDELKVTFALGLRADQLSLALVAQPRSLNSLDYAISWSFFYYLVKREPGALGKILGLAKAGQATPMGILTAFDDPTKSEASWRAFVQELVR
jgi:hypothetical protein